MKHIAWNIFHKYIACNIFAARCTLNIFHAICSNLSIWIDEKQNNIWSCATFLHATQLMSFMKCMFLVSSCPVFHLNLSICCIIQMFHISCDIFQAIYFIVMRRAWRNSYSVTWPLGHCMACKGLSYTKSEYNLFWVFFYSTIYSKSILRENREKLFWGQMWPFFKERRRLAPKINISFFITN